MKDDHLSSFLGEYLRGATVIGEPPPIEDWPAAARRILVEKIRADLGEPELVALLRSRILSEGPMPFAEFMRESLYHPAWGYYSRERSPIGPEGDYLTSPETSPLFGKALARWVARADAALGHPERLDIIEMGAESGKSFRDLLDGLTEEAPDAYRRVRGMIVEPRDSARVRQKRLLGLESSLRWVRSLDEIEEESWIGVFFSNELVDSFPAHRVRFDGERIRELKVAWNGAEFKEIEGDPSSAELIERFRRVDPPEGKIVMANLEAERWMRSVARRMREGYVLTIDYGGSTEEIEKREGGALLAAWRHAPSRDFLRRVGLQDLTVHVDFTSIERIGEESGLRAIDRITQERWLRNLGMRESADQLSNAERKGLDELMDPRGLGGYQVLLQAKDAPDPPLTRS